MFLTKGLDVIDFDLDLLVELITAVDQQIAVIESELSASADPDGLGLFDRLEGVVGLGFVACQQYLNATWKQLAKPETKEKKWLVLGAAPVHVSGLLFALIVNAAANHWKHHEEWPSPGKNRVEAETRDVINSVTPSSADYVLASLLASLVRSKQPRFALVVPEVTLWRNLQIEFTV